MMANRTLPLHDLGGHITDFLCESPADLRSCALVSRGFTYHAQRNLFHDIIFHPGCSGIDDLPVGNVDEIPICRRFCSILMASPHLIPLVRRLRTSLEDNVVRELARVKFPNLRDVVFHRNLRLERELIKKKTLVVAGTITSLPSIRRVGLLWLTLQDIQDLRRLFDHSSPHLEALLLHEVRIRNSSEEPEKPRLAAPLRRATIKQLHVPGVHGPTRALLSSLGPFDFSMLEDIEYSIVKRMQYTTALLNRGRSTITRLKVDGTLSQAHIATLALLTALTELHIRTGNTTEDLAGVVALLAALPVPSLLKIVGLQFEYIGQWEIGELDNLRTALMRTPLPSLRRLEISVRPIVSRTDGVDPRSEIRAALAEFDTMLSVVVLPLFLVRLEF
ncbi:hypothetical protein B0H14DRAFT_3143484 [Mycena olivaceomarginata]|nr:hypothetical protein B0H14DRAFT_3143484 [Mycena olivaceomarginata]